MGASNINAFFDPHTLAIGFIFAIAVIGYMIFQDWRDGKFDRNRNTIPDTGDPVLNRFLEGIAKSMQGLQAHYNDETTVLLTNIQIDHRDQFSLLRDTKAIAEKNATKLDEILKYGVPVYKPYAIRGE